MKVIVQQLNKEPFNKAYNLITFDALEPLQLLQVLNDVLAIVDPKQSIDLREETPDQSAVRIFQLLRVLKYKPPDSINLNQFRVGLVQGEKPIIYPILEYLLPRVPELQKRAYLAKYLLKIEVPADIMQDEEVNNIYMQYEDLMEQFKELHKQSSQLQNSGFNTTEIRKDITNMEDEKEQLIKRIERLRRKVESHPNSQVMMNVAKNLRVERDREKKISQQKQEQMTNIQHLDQRIKRMDNQLRDMRQASVGATPDTMIDRLEEETRANSYIVKEQLPKDVASRRKMIQDLQKVVAIPAMGQSDLDELNSQITAMNTEVNQLVEQRMRSGDPTDDKLSLFRQQAGIIAHKKEAAGAALREMREDVSKTNQELEQKREIVNSVEGAEVLKGEDFKRYVNKLRSKSTIYKKKRSELAELRAESGVLMRTDDILNQRNHLINKQLGIVEQKAGVAGYRETQETLEKVSATKSDLDDVKGRTLEDMSEMVRRLHSDIAERRNVLAPILREIRPLREKLQELTPDYDSKKQLYERTSAGLESNMSKLEQEVRGFSEECRAEECRYHYLNCMMGLLECQQDRITEEMKCYVSHEVGEKKRTMREVYTRKIQEQENQGRNLRERQKSVRENHEPNIKQMKMWRDLERLLQCKVNCIDQIASLGSGLTGVRAMQIGVGGYGEAPPAHLEEDRLVL